MKMRPQKERDQRITPRPSNIANMKMRPQKTCSKIMKDT